MTEELDQLEVENLDEDLDSTQEESDEVNEELTKAQEIANNQKIRAEKAEAELKALKKPQPKTETETPKNDNLSLKDVVALRDVHEEDLDYLMEESTLRGKTIADLKKDPYMAIILKTRAEERATADATSTAPTKRGTKRDSDETILRNFEQGKVSDNDEDIMKLVQAEQNQKRAIAKGN